MLCFWIMFINYTTFNGFLQSLHPSHLQNSQHLIPAILHGQTVILKHFKHLHGIGKSDGIAALPVICGTMASSSITYPYFNGSNLFASMDVAWIHMYVCRNALFTWKVILHDVGAIVWKFWVFLWYCWTLASSNVENLDPSDAARNFSALPSICSVDSSNFPKSHRSLYPIFSACLSPFF